ncbi:MAG TPA: class I adenylate-forming enzyme family protein [Syntrophorhabdaceae bacterium]|nr:class I adenylate-forming enzyme family protein [Syntrophorhabdaceae bacterium]
MVPIIPLNPDITLVHHFLEKSAERFPGKTAIVHGPTRVTYAELNNRASALADYLLTIGLKPGDRVALLMENSLEYVIGYYGALKASAVAVPLNSDLKAEGLRYAIEDLEAGIMVSSSKFEKLIAASNLEGLGLKHLILKGRSVSAGIRTTTVNFDDVTPSSFTSTVRCEITSRDLASIIYTSGSTGGPKGVMLSHQNIVDNTFSICQYLGLTSDDVQMIVLPFFYVMGKSLLNTHFAVGGTVILNNQFAFPATVIKEMIAEKVTGFSGVPSTFAYLVHRSPLAANREKLPCLRYVSQAGGHMAKAVKEELRRVLPAHTQIVIMYGATEAAARLSYLEAPRFADKTESIGKAIPGVTLKVVNQDGRDADIGQVGELVATGTNIMQGYWKNPEATAKVLTDGWYHTGDQAYMDEEGFFFVVGRKDDLLKVGGHRLNPQEIEDILLESGMFVEAVVLGQPDELLGMRLVTLAVPKSDECTSQKVMNFCAERLPKYKIPSEVQFTKNLPKKTSGKVDRKSCLALFSQCQPNSQHAAEK